jgi:glutamyl-tRNA reductase
MVIGEPQILGQVTEAYAQAQEHGTSGKILSRLFQAAIHAGKRAHNETTISHNPASIASIAANLVAGTVPDLPCASIMVLGAGEMAELAVEALRKRGVDSILVVNRTLSHAQELAARWGGKAAGLDGLERLLPEVDIVIASTGATQTLISADMVADAMQRRSGRPLVFMDIAFPRDVDSQVMHLPGVHLYDLDTLSQYLEANLAQREAEIPKVHAILDEEQTVFEAYLASLDVVPIIVEMRSQADNIRQDEVRRTMRRMPELTPAMERQIEAMTKSIVNKILHHPTARLREEANQHKVADYTSIARDLFGLD